MEHVDARLIVIKTKTISKPNRVNHTVTEYGLLNNYDFFNELKAPQKTVLKHPESVSGLLRTTSGCSGLVKQKPKRTLVCGNASLK